MTWPLPLPSLCTTSSRGGATKPLILTARSIKKRIIDFMKTPSILRFCAAIAFVFAAFFSVSAQTDKELGEATIKALTLFEQQRFAEAIPHLEIVVKALPDQPQARFMF